MAVVDGEKGVGERVVWQGVWALLSDGGAAGAVLEPVHAGGTPGFQSNPSGGRQTWDGPGVLSYFEKEDHLMKV